MKLLVGLGNPDVHYQNNRHNIGFKSIDSIASKYNFADFTEKWDGMFSKNKVNNNTVVLFKPMTYMNNSGVPVSKIMNFYKIPSNDIFIIYDDLDMEVAQLRIKSGGGNAGHNGLKSIDSHACTNYIKLKIGIGRPEKSSISNYVLSDFTKPEQEKMQVVLDHISHNTDALLHKDFENFMNMYYKNL